MSQETMMTISARFLLFLFAATAAVIPALGKSDTQKTSLESCTSSKGDFSTICPSTWHRIEWLGDSISIVNFPFSERDEGIIIKRDGAQIIISKDHLNGVSFLKWIGNDNTGTNVSQNGQTKRLGRRSGCDDVAYASVTVEQGIGTPEVDSQIYCKRNDQVLKFQARFWANDPKKAQYRSVLWTMFKHLKVQSK